MNTKTGKTDQKFPRAAAEKNENTYGSASAFGITDNRPETVAQRKLQEVANNGIVQRVSFGKAGRFQKTFTSKTGLTGHILGEGDGATPVAQAPQVAVQNPPVAAGAAVAPNQAPVIQAPQAAQVPQAGAAPNQVQQAPQVAAAAAPNAAQALLAEERRQLAEEHDWDGQTVRLIGIEQIWINANRSGVPGGAGITGQQGRAIWLSKGDLNAQSGYGGDESKVVHEYRPKRPLYVAVLTEYSVVIPPHDRRWVRLCPEIDGAITDYGQGRMELAVFDSANLVLIQTRAFQS